MPRAWAMLVVVAALAAPAIAQFKPIDGHIQVSREAIELQYEGQLKSFREEALALRNADGGTLTAAHRASLQLKLDQLKADYGVALKNADPWSVNSDGSRRY